jgi:hypothetical protein
MLKFTDTSRSCYRLVGDGVSLHFYVAVSYSILLVDKVDLCDFVVVLGTPFEDGLVRPKYAGV